MAASTSAAIAILPASAEIFEGTLKPSQISQRINQELLIDVAHKLLYLIYQYQPKELLNIIDQYLAELPGRKDWFE